MTAGPELDGDDVTRTILKAAAAALKVGRHLMLQEAAGLPPALSMDQYSSYVFVAVDRRSRRVRYSTRMCLAAASTLGWVVWA